MIMCQLNIDHKSLFAIIKSFTQLKISGKYWRQTEYLSELKKL